MSSTASDADIAIADMATRLLQGVQPDAPTLTLTCGGCSIRVLSNCAPLIRVLQDYFRPFLIENAEAEITVHAIESPTVNIPCPFRDWRREAGKQGRKDAYYDFAGGRLIRKVRTGMLFLQSKASRIAAGPCLTHPNQVINFINAQAMNRLQQRQWLLCHAAGLVWHERAYAIAGFSGGGKSTLMLHLLDDESSRFLSNDRLLIRRRQQTVDTVGIAKLPRVNPGTVVNNPRLHPLMPPRQREHFLALPKQHLWRIEDKYDVDIDACYGQNRIVSKAPLQALIVLNWQHDSDRATTATRAHLSERQELLAAIMKSPGPFYHDVEGHFWNETDGLDPAAYLTELEGIAVYEVKGRIDFSALRNIFHQHILQETQR